jgi:hypothetical protein
MEEELWLLLLGVVGASELAGRNRRLVKPLAACYVAFTEAVGRVVGPIRDNWSAAVAEARQERAQQAASAGGSSRHARRRQQQGEATLKTSGAAAGEVAAQKAVGG